MTGKKSKSFDCVKYKWQIQNEIYEETKDMNYKEQIAYFRERAESGALGDWWKSLKNTSVSKMASRAAK
ncbi:MAG: hypothetical protein AB1546_13995 [bacterium]